MFEIKLSNKFKMSEIIVSKRSTSKISFGYFLDEFFDEELLNFNDLNFSEIFIVFDFEVQFDLLREYLFGVDIHIFKHSGQFGVNLFLLSNNLLFLARGFYFFRRINRLCRNLLGWRQFFNWFWYFGKCRRCASRCQYLFWFILYFGIICRDLFKIRQLLFSVYARILKCFFSIFTKFLIMVCSLFKGFY